MRLRASVASGAAVLAAVAGVTTAAPASASTNPPPDQFLCRTPDAPVDGFYVHTCLTGDGGTTLRAYVYVYGGRTSINLCVKIVDFHQNPVPGSGNCKVVDSSGGEVWGYPISLDRGVYYGVSDLTSPTYFYGGETPPGAVV